MSVGAGLSTDQSGLPIGSWTPELLATTISQFESNKTGVELRTVQHWFQDNDKPPLSQRATVIGPRAFDPPEYDGHLDYGVAGCGYFEDPRETAEDEETAEDRQLTQAIETVKAPSFADNLGTLLNLAPVSSDSEPELADLAHRLSADELVNRLMPLFSGENVKIIGHSLHGA